MDALSRHVYTISQQPMPPQTSIEELRDAQNHDNKVQPHTQYLKDGTLSKDAPTAEKILCDKKNSISSVTMTFYTIHAGKRTIIQLVVPKTLQTVLLHWS